MPLLTDMRQGVPVYNSMFTTPSGYVPNLFVLLTHLITTLIILQYTITYYRFSFSLKPYIY